jgi:hypothetical protein
MRISKDGATIGDYIIDRVPEYDERIKGMYKPPRLKKTITFLPKFEEREWEKPCQYGSHQITGIASITNEERDSILFKSENNKAIYDILFLYDFFIGGAACLEEDIDRFNHRTRAGVTFEKYLEKNNINVSYLISDSLVEINKDGWKNGEKDKEILAFNFLLDAREPKSLNLQFIEEWTCLALLCSAILGNNIESKHGNKIFDGYVNEIEEIEKTNFKLCLQVIRNKYIHDGSCSLSSFKKEIEAFRDPPICKSFKDSLNNILKTETDFDIFKTNSWGVMDYFLSRIFANILNIDKKARMIDEYFFESVKEYFKHF